MKTLSTLFILPVAFFLLSSSCKKEKVTVPDQLPAETQSGKNTFGCLIDGSIWIPHGSSFRAAVTTSIQFNILNLKADKADEGIVFGIDPITSTGSYNLSAGNNRAEYNVGSTTYNCTAGTLDVTKYDKLNKILSGRFSFTAKDKNTGKTVSVTDGRFDVAFTN